MKLLTAEQEKTLRNNGQWNAARTARDAEAEDFRPVVKLFCPWGSATWLLTEIDPEDPDSAFGLCDLGMGFPELGRVSLSELASITGPGGLGIERDRHFRARQTLNEYAHEARRNSRILA
jgi:hypothetical protein